METLTLDPGKLTIDDAIRFYTSSCRIQLSPHAKEKIQLGRKTVEDFIKSKKIVYGVNTGFGKFANTVIPEDKLIDIQYNLLRSHAVGTGPLFSNDIIKLIYLFKLNGLAQGYSGIRYELIQHILACYHAGVIPVVPSKGSVGASGDLAPLAHFSLPLIGEGEAFLGDKKFNGKEVLSKAGLTAFKLAPKEGLSMVNGLQVSLALLFEAYLLVDRVWQAAILAGALSTIAAEGSRDPFDERVVGVLHSQYVSDVARLIRDLIGKGTPSHRVQDPYSLRCQPQVMGATLEMLENVKSGLSQAMNAVTDNPIVCFESKEILSGGNFHGQQLSLLADSVASVIATIGNFSERRIAMLMDPHFSNLPAFLVGKGGEHSGLMMMQVAAAALASENKVFAHPASADSIPTSNSQEDHVSMATFAARRLQDMLDNVMGIIAIELIAACQAVDLREGTIHSAKLKKVYKTLRDEVAFYENDRIGSQEIEVIKQSIREGKFTVYSEKI